MTNWIEYYKTQLNKQGVAVHLKSEVEVNLIQREKPDVVLIASGAAYGDFGVPGGTSGKVLPAGKMHKRLMRKAGRRSSSAASLFGRTQRLPSS